MTDYEIIEDAVNTIGALSIPIALAENVSDQLVRVRRNLMILAQAIKKNAEKKEEAPADSENNSEEPVDNVEN